MSLLSGIPTLLLFLPALSLAAGLDLYLTLLVLGLAPHTGLWETAPPGALGDLGSAGVLLVAGGFYFMEVAAERWPTSALVWNGFHGVIRPLSGVLLALLLLDGEPTHILAVGALLAGVLASLAHGVRTGSRVLLWLRGAAAPNRWLLSAMEDVVVIGLIALALDLPGAAAVVVLAITAVWLARGRSDIRAFLFAARLGIGRLWGSLGRARWTHPENFPHWVRRKLEGDVMAPGGGLRGSPAAAYRLPGAARFTTGWVVVRGDTPLFVHRGSTLTDRVDLGSLTTTGVIEETLFRRVDFETTDRGMPCIYLGIDGPGLEALRSEFQVS